MMNAKARSRGPPQGAWQGTAAAPSSAMPLMMNPAQFATTSQQPIIPPPTPNPEPNHQAAANATERPPTLGYQDPSYGQQQPQEEQPVSYQGYDGYGDQQHQYQDPASYGQFYQQQQQQQPMYWNNDGVHYAGQYADYNNSQQQLTEDYQQQQVQEQQHPVQQQEQAEYEYGQRQPSMENDISYGQQQRQPSMENDLSYGQQQQRQPSMENDYGQQRQPSVESDHYDLQQQQQQQQQQQPPYQNYEQDLYNQQQYMNGGASSAAAMQPDLVVAAPPPLKAEDEDGEHESPVHENSSPTRSIPEATAASNCQFGTGPDVTAVAPHEEPSEPLEPPLMQERHHLEVAEGCQDQEDQDHPEQLVQPAILDQPPQQGSHEEHYAFYQQFEAHPSPNPAASRPPDIINTEPLVVYPSSDRNLFMQTGHLDEQDEREPVDGGNEAVVEQQQQPPEVELPLDRLVLGQSEPTPSSRFVAGGSQQQNQGPIEASRFVAGGSQQQHNQGPLEASRFVAGGSQQQHNQGSLEASRFVAGQQQQNQGPVEASRFVAGQQQQNQSPTTTARSEAAGSADRHDQAVVVKSPSPAPPPPPSPPGRNVTGAAADDEVAKSRPHKHHSKRKSKETESEEEELESESEFSRGSKQRHQRHQRQQHSPDASRSSSSSPERYNRRRDDHRHHHHGQHHHGGGREKRHHESTRKRDGRRYEDHSSRHHRRPDRSYREESYRDDRSYYEDRRGGKYNNTTSSRPSSRSGSVYEDRNYSYYKRSAPDQSYYAYNGRGYGPPMPQYVAPAPDPQTLEVFRKSWEYYSRNPNEMENLRVSKPAQHENLMRYYQMYSHLLPTITVTAEEDRASVHSGRSSTAVVGVQQISPIHRSEEVYHENYQPTVQNETAFNELQKEEEVDDKEVMSINEEEQPLYEPYDPNRRLTPLMFSGPHVKRIIDPRGLLVDVEAKNPKDGQNATVYLHSLQACQLKNKELIDFPGPLVPGRTHKGEVIQFCQAKIQMAPDMFDRDSYVLMWELMILLLRQKNTIDGCDIAELLLKGRDVHKPYHDDKEEYVSLDRMSSKEEMEKHTNKFRDYLLFGHKKEGLEYAMQKGLWGHALFLASKMDERSYSQVMLRFANGLVVNDPLQTLYQLMSGRQPIAVKECADSNWGDWRPHLAMILSNAGSEALDRKSILTLGDSLIEKGFLYAGQFCYLMGNMDFGTYSNKNNKLTLIGADKKNPVFEAFASNEAIQITEIFEYVQKLSNSDYVLVPLQYYKFIYAVRLLDHGMPSTCLHYLEKLAECFGKGKMMETLEGEQGVDGVEMARQIYSLAEKLKYLDPMYTTREGEVVDMGDPQWLTDLQNAINNANNNSEQQQPPPQHGYDQEGRLYLYDPASNSYYYPDQQQEQVMEQVDAVGSTQQQVSQIEQNVVEEQEQQQQQQQQVEPNDTPLMMKPIQEEPPSFQRQESTTSSTGHPPLPLPPNNVPPVMPPVAVTAPPDLSKPPLEKPPQNNYFAGIQNQKKSPENQPNKKVEMKKKKEEKVVGKNNSGLFGRLLGKLGVKPSNQAYLPDDKDNSIVWDEDKKTWVDKNAEEDEDAAVASAPPSDMELSRNNSTANFAEQQQPPPQQQQQNLLAPPPQNKFIGGLGKRRGLAGRVDVFKNSQSAPLLAAAAAGAPAVPPPDMFVPGPPSPIEEHNNNNDNLQPPQEPVLQEKTNNANKEEAAPVFFNPTQFAGSAPAVATRRNKYA